jgi:aldose 1-epimerase
MKISALSLPLTEYLETKVYTLDNGIIEARIMTYGGIVMELKLPDKDGNKVDVALGFSDPTDYVSTKYINDCPYFGALIGRYANRIKDGRFRIVEHEYQLAKNNGKNHLHGGIKGFDKAIWDDEVIDYKGTPALHLSLLSPDGDQDYPGNLKVNVIYFFRENTFGIDYFAEADATTPINLTWHGYFNLSGEGNGKILNHVMQIDAPAITEVSKDGIPTGRILEIAGSAFDFTIPRTVASGIQDTYGGYDHNYVTYMSGDIPKLIAMATSPDTGIRMKVWSTQPGVQFYSSNFLDATLIGKSGKAYGSHAGFCLETQHFPDSPNNPHFPNTLLRPGEVYRHTTIYEFDTK